MSSLLLSLETSSPVCSVAVHHLETGRLLGQSELRLEKSHSSHLSVLISQLLENMLHSLADVAAVAVSDGPGSYTGLRIGAAAAKGLCYALDVPLLAVGTLPALARQVIGSTAQPGQYHYCPMIDARRLEVYAALYRADGSEVLPPAPLLLDETALTEQMAGQPVLFFGSGAAKFQPLVANQPHAVFLAGIEPSAVAVGELAREAYQRQEFRDVAYYEPFYLKEVYTTTPKAK
ncbi:tRNA (adenosine(37)-N6)-threonylcarbamoyltransferase complex dimerization subunit type 1 TsaB [Hymenobacter lapidiphilus]|uniref:tRNA (Adenosine(37)-N6)-threonylcarbamoyltransferase complex dimerization subunit type 1 TsaB n=1 Tax=Hymenobacter lapidiphilus TaxID=2608003 RepID=A0A7Y7U849_9BACT|nr:tRNA (adenosine(37)-N6)-threonylcarbamoyltransferase complex dimerization subunit type 1 TsaB [Hymenobacter lapidiphilus]NVO33195.1 tRNA (adenosine(37)-N6)-threonylcarbamoyltransferase complex dimerization subunit type 1 TsaB [Hymenobacter lapidiphilus]